MADIFDQWDNSNNSTNGTTGGGDIYGEANPAYASFFAVMGSTSAIVFSALGAAYGTAKSGTGISAMAIMRPELVMKSIIPVVMAGILAIYGLVVSVIITEAMSKTMDLFK